MEENVDSAIQGAGRLRWRIGVMYVPRDYGRAFETAEGCTLRAEGPESLLYRGNTVALTRGDYGGDFAPAATWEHASPQAAEGIGVYIRPDECARSAPPAFEWLGKRTYRRMPR